MSEERHTMCDGRPKMSEGRPKTCDGRHKMSDGRSKRPIQFRAAVGRPSGVVTLLTIVCVPLLLTILVVMVEVGRQWQARVQLENALESAALATVRQWGDLGGRAKNIATAQTAGLAYAQANTLHGVSIDLADPAGVPSTSWTFGTATPCGHGFTFTANPEAQQNLAVVLQATAKVPRLWARVLGPWPGDSTVTATTTAFCDPLTLPRQSKLIRLATATPQ